MSSRNAYLTDEQRIAARCLSRAIFKGEELAKNGASVKEVLSTMEEIISSEKHAKIDYISAVDLETMEDVDNFDGDRLVAIAVFVGKSRLLDNFILRG